MTRKKVTVNWSGKENDWQSRYPEWENGNAIILGRAFLTMIMKYEEFMSKDWQGKRTGFISLRNYLNEAGFDPDTFTISVKAKKINP